MRIFLAFLVVLLMANCCQATTRIKLANVCTKGGEGAWKLESYEHNQVYLDRLTSPNRFRMGLMTYLIKIKRFRFLGPHPQLNWQEDIVGGAQPYDHDWNPITCITKFGDEIIGREWQDVRTLKCVVRCDRDEVVFIQFID